jgi:putative acetyltransferase
MKIKQAERGDYLHLINVWEASVRATHDFLPEREIIRLKPLILEHYFDAVELVCASNESGIIEGFCGTHEGNIEMLFVSPHSRGLGVGKLLTNYAIQNQEAYKVDVNEQNQQALGFYERMGFEIHGRSPLDGQGKPYPLLHLILNSERQP